MGYVDKLIEKIESGNLPRNVERFSQGDFVRGAGEDFSDLAILVEGEVAIESVGKNGRILEIIRIKAHDILLPCVTFSEDPTLEVDIVAKTDCEVMFVDKEKFFDFIWKDRESALEFFTYFGKHFSNIVRRLSDIALNDLKEKIASYIVELRDEQGKDEVIFPVTREELARMLGATRPSVSRMLSYMVEEGLIEIKRNRIKVKNFEKLKEIAGY